MHRCQQDCNFCITQEVVGMQEAMRAAEKKSTEECPVKMKLVAPPLYVLTTNVSHTLFLQQLPGL